MALCVYCILNHAGGDVVHSYGRLIPHTFPITDLPQISGPDGIGRINCTVSNGTVSFYSGGAELEAEGVNHTGNGATSTLTPKVNQSNVGSYQNKEVVCTNFDTNVFYLFFSNSSKYIVIHHYFKVTPNQPYSCCTDALL